jgi:hypothetical protein
LTSSTTIDIDRRRSTRRVFVFLRHDGSVMPAACIADAEVSREVVDLHERCAVARSGTNTSLPVVGPFWNTALSDQ